MQRVRIWFPVSEFPTPYLCLLKLFPVTEKVIDSLKGFKGGGSYSFVGNRLDV